MGEVDEQSIAGAMATCTHGTGPKLGCISTLVSAFRLVLANGTVVVADASTNVDIFNAARAGIGALGVVSSVTLKTVPQWKMMFKRVTNDTIRGMVTAYKTYLAQYERFEWYCRYFS